MIEIEPYNSEWPKRFLAIGKEIRDALGATAIAIHHIGSTSVPGLVAKDIIDIQVTVSTLSDDYLDRLGAKGFKYLPDISNDHCPPGMNVPPEELRKQFFTRGNRESNVHIRKENTFNQIYPLLCREYLRAHPFAAAAYGEIKQQLAHYFPEDEDAYYAIKDPVFDILMTGAHEWKSNDWSTPPSDA